MTAKERIKELLLIIQAWVDGKPIQYRRQLNYAAQFGPWLDLPILDIPPEFQAPLIDWRIKPEPREWWLVGPHANPTMPYGVWSSKPNKEHCPNHEIIHVREVLE